MLHTIGELLRDSVSSGIWAGALVAIVYFFGVLLVKWLLHITVQRSLHGELMQVVERADKIVRDIDNNAMRSADLDGMIAELEEVIARTERVRDYYLYRIVGPGRMASVMARFVAAIATMDMVQFELEKIRRSAIAAERALYRAKELSSNEDMRGSARFYLEQVSGDAV